MYSENRKNNSTANGPNPLVALWHSTRAACLHSARHGLWCWQALGRAIARRGGKEGSGGAVLDRGRRCGGAEQQRISQQQCLDVDSGPQGRQWTRRTREGSDDAASSPGGGAERGCAVMKFYTEGMAREREGNDEMGKLALGAGGSGPYR
jgi:sirohydrochlorin ferrochelatase